MFSKFFLCLIYTSFAGSVLAGIIILTKSALRNKLGAKWNSWIWMLLLLRLCMPSVPQSPFSVFNLFKLVNLIKTGGSSFGVRVTVNSSVSVIDNFQNDILPQEYFLPADGSFHPGRLDMLFLIWFSVTVVLITYVVIHNLRVRDAMKTEIQLENAELIGLFESCKKTMNITTDIKMLKAGRTRSPALYGMIRPVLLLPEGIETKLDNVGLTHIMMHELAHYKRKDILLNSIISFFQILHWFNPFLWYALNWMRQDIEMACDAMVLRHLVDGGRKGYAATIISSMEYVSDNSLLTPMASISGGNTQIRKRIKMIMSFKKETVSEFIWKSAVVLMVGCIALTNGTVDTAAYHSADNTSSEIVYEDMSPYFQGYEGSFVLLDLEKERYYIFNEKKAKERLSPYSTFKPVDALIALQTGALKNDAAVMKWDGTQYPFKQWNMDQTLDSAMTYSVNWYFEELCQQVGKEDLKKYIKLLDYGNQDLSGGIRDFWNQSSLAISPEEQVEILRKIYTYDTPFSKSNVDIVKEAMKLTEINGSTLFGKTGSGLLDKDRGTGWFTGFVEKGEKAYVFAANIQGDKQVNGVLAREITLSILNDKGIYQ